MKSVKVSPWVFWAYFGCGGLFLLVTRKIAKVALTMGGIDLKQMYVDALIVFIIVTAITIIERSRRAKIAKI